MKINELQNAQTPGTTQKTTKKGAEGSGFQKILESKQSRGTESATPGVPIQSSPSSIPVDLRIESLQVTEQTISTLDEFSSALGNLKFSGDDIQPLVEALEDETRSILELKNQLPPQDPLADLLDRVATVSYVETAKYRRGDYQ
jgi:hypothetical protein